jgi:glycosyltransferase involved in cell wall biosynthesis
MRKIYLLEKHLGKWSLSADKDYVKKFLSKMGYAFTDNIFNADIIYSVWYYSLFSKKKFYLIKLLRKLKNVKVVTTVTNEEIISKDFDGLKRVVDCWIVPNKRMYNFLESNGFKLELIPFYVDRELFEKTNKTKEEICEILKIDYDNLNGKFLIGSFQRDSLGSNLTNPKWQKNPDLLVKVLRELPKDKIVLILAGPRRHYIIDQCEKHNIPYCFYGKNEYVTDLRDDLIENNIGFDKIALLYNLIDLYIVSSRIEGGPKSVLESSLTKTLIVSTEVGLAPDMLHEDLIYQEENYQNIVNFIKDIIQTKKDMSKYIEYNFDKVSQALDQDILMKKYKAIIENV